MNPPPSRPHLLLALALALALVSSIAASAAPSTSSGQAKPQANQPSGLPNIVIVIGDDATFSDLPLHGGTNVATPHLDKLASQGMAFNHAYLTMSMCQPCRAELYTGQYPVRNGCTWNHSACHPDTKSVPHYFGDLGYRVGLAGKTHIVPKTSFPFESIPGFESGCVKDTADGDCGGIRTFMTDAKVDGAPFFLVVALVSPHAPWTVGDPSVFNRKKLVLPPNFIDTPETRESFALYLAEIAYMDRQLGDVMDSVDAAGLAENTIFIFTSEQGAQFPGCKWTCWDQGVHTAFVVRWPGTVTPGTRTDAMIQYADVAPTLLQIAGGTPPADPANAFDGTSFLGVLRGEKTEHRDFVFAMHNNVPEGPPYPIRSVATREFRYIRNLTPEKLYIEKHLAGVVHHNPYYGSWWFATWNNEHAMDIIRRWTLRPGEEFYDRAADPFELENLAADTAHAKAREKLSAELDRWIESQGDPGIALDSLEALQASKDAVALKPPPAKVKKGNGKGKGKG